MNRTVEFYLGRITDDCGRTIEEIWAWDDQRLENVHDYIQWLFPSRRPSGFNPGAPLLTTETVAAFRASPELQKRLAKSFHRMLQFYGFRALEHEDIVRVERASSWRERFGNWVSIGNHNHLRITRILACLRTLGLGEYSRAFLQALDEVHVEFADSIETQTIDFWRSASRL